MRTKDSTHALSLGKSLIDENVTGGLELPQSIVWMSANGQKLAQCCATKPLLDGQLFSKLAGQVHSQSIGICCEGWYTGSIDINLFA